jgi:hypothetical protein
VEDRRQHHELVGAIEQVQCTTEPCVRLSGCSSGAGVGGVCTRLANRSPLLTLNSS